jgi:carboxypeptidase C (cathepsin A)
MRRAAVLLAAVAVCAPCAAPAAQTPDAVTKHTLQIDGKTLHYTARAGTIVIQDDKSRPAVEMFYTAYTEDGATASQRPVTFFYNGGPGGSSVWQRMAAFGPVRVIPGQPGGQTAAPYRLVQNQYSLLDKTDEVYVDAPGTGYSRLLPGAKPAEYYGVDQDAAAFAQFIRDYLSANGRWNSPKYLFGESYGTVRSAAVANQLSGGFGQAVELNGIVEMSSALNVNLIWDDQTVGGTDWPFVLFLPTEAATAWYHGLVPNRPTDLRAFLNEAETFAVQEYLPALAQGDRLPQARRDEIVRKLHRYTGLSEAYIRTSNLRITPARFRGEVLRSSGKSVGYMDTRYSAYDIDREREVAPWDASDLAATPAVVALFNDYVHGQLEYKTPLEYLSLIPNLPQWSWRHASDLGGTAALLQPPNTIADLAESMAKNPGMRVFAAMGYYDMSTPYFQQMFDYTHLNLPPGIEKNITFGQYEAGHMMYTDPAVLAKIKADLDRWYDR